MFVYREARIANSGYEKFAVHWLNEAFLLCWDKFQLIYKLFLFSAKSTVRDHANQLYFYTCNDEFL
jgi:hypothetical protein